MFLQKSLRQASLSVATILVLLTTASTFAPSFASHRHGSHRHHDHHGHSSGKKVCYHRHDGVRCFYVKSR